MGAANKTATEALKASATNLTPSKIREYAARHLVDPRTLERYLRGERVKTLAAERCRAACDEAGVTPPKQSGKAA